MKEGRGEVLKLEEAEGEEAGKRKESEGTEKDFDLVQAESLPFGLPLESKRLLAREMLLGE